MTVNNNREDPLAAVLSVTNGRGTDVTIEAVGVPATFGLATQLVRAGGHVANIGVHAEPATLHLEDLWIKDVTITTGLVKTYSTPTLLRLVTSLTLDAEKFATHHFTMDEFISAYRVFHDAVKTGALKVVDEGRISQTSGGPCDHAALRGAQAGATRRVGGSRREENTPTRREACVVTLPAVPPQQSSFIGVDVGATSLWFAALSGSEAPEITAIGRVGTDAVDEVAHALSGAAVVAIDAPEEPSANAHLGDSRYAPKFQRARCSEVALRHQGIAVPFVTPGPAQAAPTWMEAGFTLWKSANQHAGRVLETYPHGIFWRLAGRPLQHKQREEGRAARREALAQRIQLPLGANLWPHDALDALACALVAWLAGRDAAERISCEGDLEWTVHDGSAIWLPPVSS